MIELRSLRKGERVEAGVLDTWVLILNSMETYTFKYPNKRRFFFSTTPVASSIVYKPAAYNTDQLYEKFQESVNHDIDTATGDPTNYRLFFFSVIATDQIYVICIDLDVYQTSIHILGNSSADGAGIAKYGDIPFLLKDYFVRYLNQRDSYSAANRLKKITPQRMLMQWSDTEKKDDSGVFTMCIMQTYMGDDSSKNKQSDLADLRVKYITAILTAEINELS
ncbi:PREDICTED: uncharacterized protein LOC109152092 [Ipomoea nil]|uniref:uncharacterized protein LOC109152092 n=1 Tax=Ipomoea nil TaxID=35883 RepID=UPI0009012818|nr:PREDICTED: uncharacterized protein LOC109152092 [Ipomoea nil]